MRKEGNMPRLTYQAKSLPLQREFGRVALPSVRSNGPTDPLHISCICSIWKILHFYSSLSLWIRQSPLSSTRWHFRSLLPKNHKLFIVSKQCACSIRDHIEGHMNRVGLNWILVIMDNNSDNDSFGSFLSKKKRTQIVSFAA